MSLASEIIASEIISKITEVIRNIVLSVYEILLPILTTLGTAQLLVGLLLALGLRQEYLGWRLVISGGIMLIFVHFVAPFLLSFL